MQRVVKTQWLILVASAWCLAGCASSGPETIPVYGKITFVSRDTPKICRVFFQPVESETVTRPSVATAQPDGSYEVKSFRRSKGLMPGKYKVQVSYYDLKPGANPDIESSYAESVYDAPELTVEPGSEGIEHNIEVPARATRAGPL